MWQVMLDRGSGFLTNKLLLNCKSIGDEISVVGLK